MKRWMVLVAFLAALAFQVGCGGDGMAYTRTERLHRAQRILEYDRRMYADDVDLFWLSDRPLRASSWSIP